MGNLVKPEDVDEAIAEVKEIISRTSDSEEKKNAQKLLNHFLSIKSGERKIEPLLVFTAGIS